MEIKWNFRKQPPRPVNEISVREGVPSWKMSMCSRHRGFLWNIVCVRGLDRVSPNLDPSAPSLLCSRTKKGFLENEYLFDEKIEAPGKFVCVRGLKNGFWENEYLFDEIIKSVRRTR